MKYLKIISSVMLLSILFLTGCNRSADSRGIYYPALSHSFLKQNLAPAGVVACSYSSDAFKLYYNGEVYTLSHFYQEYSKNNLPLETMLGKELCTVYGNQKIHWADNKEDLASCTHTGILYQVPGYREDFRVCLYFEEPANVDLNRGPMYHLYVLDRTNNITLYRGKDYYTGLYRFPTDASINGLPMENPTIAAFTDALLVAEFIDPATEDLPSFDFNTDKTYHFQFTDSLGLSNSVAIFEDGYVVDNEDHNFILKLDPSLCRSVIDLFHQPEWPGEYKYVTYTYDKEQDIRTEYKYELTVTESDTHVTFDLYVTRTEVPVNSSGTLIDIPVTTGPVVNFSITKEEAAQKHSISIASQRFPDTAPELMEYIELKKGLQEDIISLRYANSEEELAEKEFVSLYKQ